MNAVFFVPEYRSFGDSALFVDFIKELVEKINLDLEIIYIKKKFDLNQQKQFLYASYVADVVIVDCTIPSKNADGGVYPVLTEQINCLNHIIVVSETNLPLNITPYRGVYPKKEGERYNSKQITDALPQIIEQSLEEDTYQRLPLNIYKNFWGNRQKMMKMLSQSLDYRKKDKSLKTSVMISYRNSHCTEIDDFKKIIESTDANAKIERERMGIFGNYELIVLRPGSLCGSHEALTAERRWMLVKILEEDHIRNVDEVWVYESRDKQGNIDYLDSWWTIAEMIMVAYINFSNNKKIKIKVFNPSEKKLHDTTEFEYAKYCVAISPKQYQKIAGLFSNLLPTTNRENMQQTMKKWNTIARKMYNCNNYKKKKVLEETRKHFDQSVPSNLKGREEIINYLVNTFTNPQLLENYINDESFNPQYWETISYQIKQKAECFIDEKINVDKFFSFTREGKTHKDLNNAIISRDGIINYGTKDSPSYCKVTKAKFNHYLWHATRMGRPTIIEGNAPGLERIPIYNIENF